MTNGRSQAGARAERVPALEGWREIAAFVAERTGLRVTEDAVKRWARRIADPLPARRFNAGRRPRIAADAAALAAWVDRQWTGE